MTAPPALRMVGVGKRYGRRSWALRDCDLELPAGQVIGLVGANGAGRTTLLHLAIGLLRPTVGEVELFGADQRPFDAGSLGGSGGQFPGGQLPGGRFPGPGSFPVATPVRCPGVSRGRFRPVGAR